MADPVIIEKKTSHLHDSVLINIVSRVPWRSVLRFRCVSKQWHDLSSDPWLRQLRPKPHALVMTTSEQPVSCRSHEEAATFVLPASNDGGKLVTFSLSSIEGDDERWEGSMRTPTGAASQLVPSGSEFVCIAIGKRTLIVNPNTGWFVELPVHPEFGNSIDASDIGFAYIPSSKEYKVVRRLFRSEPTDCMNARKKGFVILNIAEQEHHHTILYWRPLNDDIPVSAPGPGDYSYDICPSSKPVLVDGSLHWQTWPQFRELRLVSLDLEAEKFGIFAPQPPVVVAEDRGCMLARCSVVQIRGELWVVDYQEGGSLGNLISMWVFNKEKDKEEGLGFWAKKYIIRRWEGLRTAIPVDIVGDVVLFKDHLSDYDSGKLRYYSTKTHSLTNTKDYPNIKHLDICHYTEGFSCLVNLFFFD